jgi:hypothetical protein
VCPVCRCVSACPGEIHWQQLRSSETGRKADRGIILSLRSIGLTEKKRTRHCTSSESVSGFQKIRNLSAYLLFTLFVFYALEVRNRIFLNQAYLTRSLKFQKLTEDSKSF